MRMTRELQVHLSTELRAAGDTMQSEGSRVAEWAREQPVVPYEVRMAIFSLQTAIDDWTEGRKAESRAALAKSRDDFTSTVEGAAAYERQHGRL